VRVLVLLAVLLVAAVLSTTATASERIDLNADNVKLAVNANGEALVTYRAAGSYKHVLAGGAVNAIAPTTARKQVEFNLDYTGGSENFGDECGAYDGPALHWLVTACKAPDGSYWALQAWRRLLPDYGLAPTATAGAWELRLSHWTGEIAQLHIDTDWAWHRYDHLYGTYTYNGSPVFGFKSKPSGDPLDTFGRNIYVDTFNSAYGSGWRREISFLAHNPTGAFCYSVNPHGKRPSGKGTRYRATVIGPGVTPDVFWEGSSPGPYDRSEDRLANRAISGLRDKLCQAN
jgi:hypothetical protein